MDVYYIYIYIHTYTHTHIHTHKQTAEVIEYELLPRTALLRKKLDALEDSRCGCVCHGEPTCGRGAAVSRWWWEKAWVIGEFVHICACMCVCVCHMYVCVCVCVCVPCAYAGGGGEKAWVTGEFVHICACMCV